MMAAYIAAVLLVMGYLATSSILGQKIEYMNVTIARSSSISAGETPMQTLHRAA